MLKNCSIACKLFLLAGTPLAGLFAFAIVTFSTVNAVRVGGPAYVQIAMGKDLVADILPPPAYIVEAYLVVLRIEGETNADETQRLIERFAQLEKEFDDRIGHWAKQLPEGVMKETLLGPAEKHARHFFAMYHSEFLPAVQRNDRARAIEIARGPIREAFAAHRASIEEVVKHATESVSGAEASAATTIHQSRLILWLVLAAGFTAALSTAYVLSRSINRPVLAMKRCIEGISSGQMALSCRVDDSGKDEIGQLGAGVNRFISKLDGLLSTTSEVAARVSASADGIQELANHMSQQMDMQGSKVQEISASVTEMSASAHEVAERAGAAANAAQESGRLATQGGNTVATSIEGMTAIERGVQNSVHAVNSLSERSKSIGKMISIINDIADQTNLLALNAAIEAARAGDHGRGFAVVADEVRKLADRTTKATDEIAVSIREIQQETAAAVKSMDEGVHRVTDGTALAGKAGNDLEQIVSSAATVDSMIKTIATAAKEQSATTEHVSRALVDISAVTTNTRQGAAEVLNAIGSLSSHTQDLQRAIGECGLKR
jgi:methyl-accepting chemotaxis protein